MNCRADIVRRRLGSLPLAASIWLLTATLSAQDAPAVAPPPPAAEAPAETPAASPEPAAADVPTPSPAADSGELEALKARLAALEAKQEEADVAALLGTAGGAPVDDAAERDLLRIYGFLEVGYTHLLIPDTSFLYKVAPTRSGSFVLGNLDLYFDAQPTDRIRALAEVRFTNYPHGEETNFGGIGGTYQRTDTTAHDFGSASGNMTNRWGGIIIENAWAQYRVVDYFQIRVGQFLAPVGVWYVDHGSPTLVSLSLPFFVSNEIVPLHQTGIQFLGDISTGSVDLSYRAYVSNGRTPALLDFTNDKALGARFAATITDDYTLTLGTSVYWGRVKDIVKNITAVSPSLTVAWEDVLDYTETVIGLDVSLDVGDLRLRSEGYFRRLTYEPGKHAPLDAPGQFRANAHEYDVYALAAYDLGAGFEAFLYGEYWRFPGSVGSDVIIGGLGVAYHITATAQVKAQLNRSFFNDFDSGADKSNNNFSSLYARFIVAF